MATGASLGTTKLKFRWSFGGGSVERRSGRSCGRSHAAGRVSDWRGSFCIGDGWWILRLVLGFGNGGGSNFSTPKECSVHADPAQALLHSLAPAMERAPDVDNTPAARVGPRPHRCNDRLEDFVQALFEGDPRKHLPGPATLFWRCYKSNPGEEPTEPFFFLEQDAHGKLVPKGRRS